MREKTLRFYRFQHRDRSNWFSFQVRHRETDLWIRAHADLRREAHSAVVNFRHQLDTYISRFPSFLESLEPLPDDPLAPELVRRMLQAGLAAGVGPMAGVAGAMAEAVAVYLEPASPSIIVENGGDCFLDLDEDTVIGVYAGKESPFSGKIGLRLTADRFPIGVCTSSGTLGHSLSFGKADAVTVLSRDAASADAAATALGNLVKSPGDIAAALERAPDIPCVEGVLILVRDRMGIWGNLELVRL